MSDSESGQTPAQAGKELADPSDTMSSKPTQNDSQNGTQAQKIGQAINGFSGLYARMTGQCWATVLSTRNDGISAYRCNIEKLECYAADGNQCPDYEFNESQAAEANYQGSGVCDHLAVAIHTAPQTPDLGTRAVDASVEMLSELRDAADSAHNTAKVMERAQATQAHTQAQAASQSGSDAPSDAEREPEGQSAQEAALRLQEAFDDITSGMDVQHDGGKVWINKTPDAPDWTFSAWLQDPDMVSYEPDGGPGEYLDNWMEAGDVSEYISEVLE